jgi:hypothetical protein
MHRAAWPRAGQGRIVLVSHRYRFIFTKTAKTGGTSVEAYFERFCLPDEDFVPTHGRPAYESASGIIGYRGARDGVRRRWFNHMSARNIQRELGDEIWNGYFKFCTIRDPFEKAISAFEHFGKDYTVPLSELRRRLGWPASERERFRRWLAGRRLPIDRAAYMIGGKICVDDFIRYETLEADMARICAHVGVPWEPQRLPRYNGGHAVPPPPPPASIHRRRSGWWRKRIAGRSRCSATRLPRWRGERRRSPE